MINHWMKWDFLLRTKDIAFSVFRTLWLVSHTLLPNTCSKLKIETLYWYADRGRSQLCHAVFIFNFEHIQQINVTFLIINFKQLIIKFASWAQDEIRKIT